MFGIDANQIIQSGGLLLVGLIIFAECGLLIGFFLPGDTLLISAGFFAAQGKLPLGWLLIIVLLATLAGYEAGYEIGHRAGKKIFTKRSSLLFDKAYIDKSEGFYERHGGKTIVLARFIPIIRTFAAVVAGVSNMPRRKFTIYNIVGAIPWSIGVTLIGYWLGARAPSVERYFGPAALLATVFTFGPTIFHLAKSAWRRRQKTEKSD